MLKRSTRLSLLLVVLVGIAGCVPRLPESGLRLSEDRRAVEMFTPLCDGEQLEGADLVIQNPDTDEPPRVVAVLDQDQLSAARASGVVRFPYDQRVADVQPPRELEIRLRTDSRDLGVPFLPSELRPLEGDQWLNDEGQTVPRSSLSRGDC